MLPQKFTQPPALSTLGGSYRGRESGTEFSIFSPSDPCLSTLEKA